MNNIRPVLAFAVLLVFASNATVVAANPLVSSSAGFQPTNRTNASTSTNRTTVLGAPPAGSGSLPESCTVVIRSFGDFDRLQPGETGCVPGNTTVEMPMSENGTVIPPGASLLSNGGTLVYSGSPTTPKTSPRQLLTLRSNTRIRGLNVVGPIAGRETGNPWTGGGYAGREGVRNGIDIIGQGVEVSFVTVRGWPNSAIDLDGNATASVHHARIVGQYSATRGYGVAVSHNSTARVAASYLDRNRHSLEAEDSGSYTVVNSVIGPTSVSHSLDVHPPAGGHYVYRNLTVMSDDGLTMRQVPKQGALLENVWFTRATPERAIVQVEQYRCDKDGQTHCANGSAVVASEGYDGFQNMQFRNIHYEKHPPAGVGLPTEPSSPTVTANRSSVDMPTTKSSPAVTTNAPSVGTPAGPSSPPATTDASSSKADASGFFLLVADVISAPGIVLSVLLIGLAIGLIGWLNR